MADQDQALIARGLSQGQGPDINELAQALQQQGAQRPPAAFAGRTPGTGVGVIDLFTRGRRADEAREIAASQVPATFAASGVDPAAGIAGRADAVQQLLANPSTRAQGLVELGNMQTQQGINMTGPERSILLDQMNQAQIKSKSDALAFQQAQGLPVDRALLVSTSRDLRQERTKDLAPYNDSLRSFDELNAALELDSGPASMAVLFKFIKALDDSVVRASEGELLTSSSGPVRALVDQFNQIQAGGLFGEDTKNDIREVATAIAQTQFGIAQRINADHDKVAARFGERFGMPSVIELSQSAAFDPGRTFGPGRVGGGGGGSSGEPAATATGETLTGADGTEFQVIE